jgi:hypothetical protein
MTSKRKKIFVLLGSVLVILCIIVVIAINTSKKAPPSLVVSGIVKDADTGKPIVGAKVSDGNYAGGKQFGITDSNGEYQYLTWPEEHGIVAEAPGYKSQRQLFTTKVFNKEKEKVIDFALVKE